MEKKQAMMEAGGENGEGCRVACGGGRVGESNGGATCSCGQLVVVEGGGVQMLFRCWPPITLINQR